MNAKEELIKAQGDRTIAWARIRNKSWLGGEIDRGCKLEPDSNFSYYTKFINCLDFEYANGYGNQELFGIVMFTDGTWLERDEYDGSEEWRLVVKPKFEDENR